MNGDRVLRIIATLTLWLAPLPAAFFVGRSVYWHLIFNWHLSLGGIGIVAAVITGGMIELVGILSAHTALACWRWNHHGNVKKAKSPWERAPFALAVTCFLVYALVAIILAVVLEALPFLAVYAPALVTAMAATAYVSLGVYEQQRDRLARYNLEWNWKASAEKDTEPEMKEPEDPEISLHRRAIAEAPDKKSQILFLMNTEPTLKQSDIARILGTSQGYVSSIAKDGKRREVQFDNLANP